MLPLKWLGRALMTTDVVPRHFTATFTLPFALAGLNVRQRKHWGALTSERNELAKEVMAGIRGPRHYPRPPLNRARITVVRCCAQPLDPDNLVASVKPLLDVLCVKSATHPAGLGIIVDDNAKQCELVVKQSSAPRGKGATIVSIEELV